MDEEKKGNIEKKVPVFDSEKPLQKGRVINTANQRNIDEDQLLNKDDDIGFSDEEVEEKINPPIMEDPIEPDLNEENILPYYEKNYLQEVLDSDPILKAGLTYQALKRKQKVDGLVDDEKQFLESYEKDLAEQQEKEIIKTENDKLIQDINEMKQNIMKEYQELKKTNPGRVATLDEQKMALNGDESFIDVLKFVKLLGKAKKSGGKVLVQVFKTRKVVFQYTKEDLLFVEFFSKDEKGNQVMDVCRFNEYKYSWEGSPVPVLFAVQGFAEGFDFYSDYRKSLDSETVNNLMLRSYHAGFLKGAEIREPENKTNTLENWMPILMIVCVVGVLVMLYFGYVTYDKLKFLNTDTMTQLANMARAYADSNGGMIVQQVGQVVVR